IVRATQKQNWGFDGVFWGFGSWGFGVLRKCFEKAGCFGLGLCCLRFDSLFGISIFVVKVAHTSEVQELALIPHS
ncbi:hypothetical protein AKJ16_DCAP00175, partial [Drosera capensis]